MCSPSGCYSAVNIEINIRRNWASEERKSTRARAHLLISFADNADYSFLTPRVINQSDAAQSNRDLSLESKCVCVCVWQNKFLCDDPRGLQHETRRTGIFPGRFTLKHDAPCAKFHVYACLQHTPCLGDIYTRGREILKLIYKSTLFRGARRNADFEARETET